MFLIFFQILNKRKSELNTWIDEIKSNNPNADVSELIVQKLSENSYLLDDLIMSKLPNGDPMPDSMIEEELHLLAFTVSSNYLAQIRFHVFLLQRKLLIRSIPLSGSLHHNNDYESYFVLNGKVS